MSAKLESIIESVTHADELHELLGRIVNPLTAVQLERDAKKARALLARIDSESNQSTTARG